ncbi:MAG: VirE N-terminal domain [Bacteroidetes bacterium]|nr:VirE N-terminal domain [Bacteroidota bacterium]
MIVKSKERVAASSTASQEETKFQLWQNKCAVNCYTEITATQLVEKLKTNASNPKFLEMREQYKTFIENGSIENKAKYDKLKGELELLTIPAKVHPRRQTKDIIGVNNLVVMDFDLKDNPFLLTEYVTIVEKLKLDKNVFMLFKSPNGLCPKVLVKVNFSEGREEMLDDLAQSRGKTEDRINNIETLKYEYKKAHHEISQYMKDNYNLAADMAANYILGQTYLSADKDPYLNEESSFFELKGVEMPIRKVILPENQTCNSTYQTSNYEILWEIECFVSKYRTGRHNLTMHITLQATYYNIPKNDIIDYCYQRFGATDHPLAEITRTVDDFYGKPYRGTQYTIREVYRKKKYNNYYGY